MSAPAESTPPLIVGIGELLWDRFPQGKRPGGAPANFAFHARQLGARGLAVSAVGADSEGAELTALLAAHGLPAPEGACIQVDPDHATGSVIIEVVDGEPQYEIVAPAAWDFLNWTPDLAALAQTCDAICFGTLAQRGATSRATIQRFVAAHCENRPEALRIFDINLRQQFFTVEVLQWGLNHATVLKLNQDELPVLAALFGLPSEPLPAIRAILSTFPVQLVALTLGAEGAWLVSQNEHAVAASEPIVLADAVGAGDAFTAALAVGLTKRLPLQKIAQAANRLGAYVASQRGAMPQHRANHLAG